MNKLNANVRFPYPSFQQARSRHFDARCSLFWPRWNRSKYTAFEDCQCVSVNHLEMIKLSLHYYFHYPTKMITFSGAGVTVWDTGSSSIADLNSYLPYIGNARE